MLRDTPGVTVYNLAMITWLHSLEEAASRAAQEHKLILLDFFNPG